MDLPSAWLEPISSLNPVDLVLAGVVLAGAVVGLKRGFVTGMQQLVTLVGSLALAFLAYPVPAAWLSSNQRWLGPWIDPLSFFASYLVAQLILGVIARRVAHAVPHGLQTRLGNRLLGLVPGLLAGLVSATVAALLLLTLPLFDNLATLARDSALANRLAPPAEWLQARLEPIFDPAVRHILQALTVVEPESRTVIQLPFKLPNPTPRPDLETQMIDLVNGERAKQGLKPLQADPELTAVARAHARDMLARGYFSHVTPERQDAFERMRQARVRFHAAGENIALARTITAAHQGLMRSPGHRANLLRPKFGLIGIGVLDGGMHGLIITQDFTN